MTLLADAQLHEPEPPTAVPLTVRALQGTDVAEALPGWVANLPPCAHPAHDLRWLGALSSGLRQRPFVIEAHERERLVGLLPLALVKSAWFGRYLTSLPYVNSAGPILAPTASNSLDVEKALIERAVGLADELSVRYLELRNERQIEHPALAEQNASKVHMRLALPSTENALLASFKSKLRSQLKGALKQNFEVRWGGHELLGDFYRVFSRNMRDLGTPVYPRGFFTAILDQFASDAELCVLHSGAQPAAAALLVHGIGITEIPSASSLKSLNSTGANMAMYWRLLVRAIERGQTTFDFGRSTEGSGTYKFKEQWGAKATPAVWQYHVRKGSAQAMRPDNGKFGLAIRIWQQLPLWLANAAGPMIVRGIP